MEASHFQRVDDRIVRMGRVMKLEAELRSRLKLFLIILDNSRHILWKLSLYI